ncbi:MAG: lysostaphin resistance A-like protein [Oscillospiraceae bacterium]
MSENLTAMTAEEMNLKMTYKRVKGSYNWAGGLMLIQFAIIQLVAVFGSIIGSVVMSVQIAMQGVTDPAEMQEKLMESMSSPFYLLMVNAAAYLIANTVCFLIARGASKNVYPAKVFGKSAISALDGLLCVLTVLGLQGLSMFIQVAIISITGVTGVSEQAQAMMSFSDDMKHNVLMVIYFVFIAGITEELFVRGGVMKLLSPVSKPFAVIASAILFGLMHGNFNQMFNGFLLGLAIGYAAMKSRSLWVPIICHICANTVAIVIAYFEYSIGDGFETTEFIYAGAVLVIGAAAAVLLYKRNGKVTNEDGFPCDGAPVIADEGKKLTWKAFVKSPTVWITAAIYIIYGISCLTTVQ